MLKRFALLAALLSSPAFADTLVTNVKGVQVGADGKLQRFGAMTIGEDGKVRQLIERPELVRLANITSTIDGGGRTLLPGLIDAHGHVMGLGMGALQLDVTGASSLSDLQQRLRAYAAANNRLPWIIGRGWNQELWSGKAFPSAADLDRIVADRPVVLERVDGHALVVNSAALTAAGITSATKDPIGGKIERDAQGRPTGLLIDAATKIIEAKKPKQTLADRVTGLAKAQSILLSYGVTATADMGTSRDEWLAMRAMGDDGRLKLRIMSYATVNDPLETAADTKVWHYGDRLRMGGVKIYDDGALGSRGAWLKRSYADAPNTRGLQFLSNAQLREQLSRALSLGLQPAVHAIGDAANAQVISAYEALGKRYGKARRFRIEHAQVVDPVDIPRLAKAGIIASMQPTHQTSDRLMASERLGTARLGGAYAWRTIARSGARLAFGSDYPVESPNPFPGLSAAVSRQDPNGQPRGGWRPQERVSFERALAGFTRDAAYAGFAEDRIGSLEPGKWADFILVDRDPTVVNPQELAGTTVLQTWIAGEKVFDASAPSPGK
ncbi:amidohydrolase family protein [Sphingomonas piscis]|uniref:Amidohydrolase family protein n=1 Tax=Sphingomonas piscis TaxID=2714943 RepID=A0A6G7YRA9_9SPHN|nr:amidohydrolase [Sphingomonas piscis]QIK79273.1 amidohydrolase family protein [Sphingomonas piscis]